VPVTHRGTNRSQIRLAELQAEPLLLRERGSGTRAALENALADAHLDLRAFRIVGEMGSTQAIKQAVKAGVGVSVVSRRAVEEECKAGLCWCLRVKDLKVSRSFHLATHRERSRSPLAEAFRIFLEAETVNSRIDPVPRGIEIGKANATLPTRDGSRWIRSSLIRRPERKFGSRATPRARAEPPRWALEISRACWQA